MRTRFGILISSVLLVCALFLGVLSGTSAETATGCQEALDYYNRYTEEVLIPLQEERAGPFDGFRISRDWLLDNDPPTLFVPIHATMIDLFNFMLNESLAYVGSPEAVGTPIVAIMDRHLDDLHETYDACPELEQAMINGHPAATPATPVP